MDAVFVTAQGSVLSITTNAIYRCAPGEARWHQVQVFPGSSVNTKRFRQGPDGTVYAASKGAGTWVSHDDGVNWTRIQGAPSYLSDIVSVNAQTLMAAAHGDGFVVSTNGGANWSARNTGLPDPYLGSIVRDGAGRLFVGSQASNGPISRSTDDGATWTPLPSAPTRVEDILLAADGSLLAANGQFWRSTDHGDSWTQASHAELGETFRLHQANDASIYAAGYNAEFLISRSTDNGATWQRLTTPLKAGNLRCIASGTTSALYVASTKTILKSSDQGGTWNTFTEDLQVAGIVGIVQCDDGTLVSGSDYGGLARSVDGGTTWNAVPLDQDEIAAVSGNGGAHVLVGCRWGQVFRSTDRGSTFTLINASTPLSNIQDLRETSAGTILVLHASGIAKTTDGGANWTELAGSLPAGGFVSIMQRTNGDILAGTQQGEVYRSTNEGVSWTQTFSDPPCGRINAIAEFGGNTIALATAGYDVQLSKDGGQTWTRVHGGLTTSSIRDIGFSDAGTPICLPYTGISMLHPGGDRWITLHASAATHTVLLAAADHRLYVGTANDGLYRSARILDATAPATPSLRTPADGASTSRTPLFSWQPASDVLYHDIQVGRDAGMQTTIWDFSIPATTSIAMDAGTLDTLGEYYWRLASGNMGGRSGWTTAWRFTTGVSTGVDAQAPPAAFDLSPAWPQPARDVAFLRLDLRSDSHLAVRIMDALGRQVAVLHDGWRDAGSWLYRFDGRSLPAGIYTVVASAGSQVRSQHLLLLP